MRATGAEKVQYPQTPGREVAERPLPRKPPHLSLDPRVYLSTSFIRLCRRQVRI